MQPIQQEEARRFVARLLRKPDAYLEAIDASQKALVLRMTCSSTKSLSAEALWKHIAQRQRRPQPDLSPLLRIWPVLRYLPSWFPGANFREMGEQYHAEDSKVWLDLLGDVKQEFSSGKAKQSFLSRWLESDAGSRYSLSDKEIAFAAGNLLTAGGDVSPECQDMCSPASDRNEAILPLSIPSGDEQLPDVTLRIFILTMLHHPLVCKRAQAEIDGVVGRERLPDFDDKDHLPFTRAVILETQRWRPLTPIGVCHTATEVGQAQYGIQDCCCEPC